VYLEVPRGEGRPEELAVGERGPARGRGRLYQVPGGIEMRLDGHALRSAVRYELEKLRCSACGQGFTATLPAAAGTEKYSARARAVYRLEGYQARVGVPVPDATQWDLLEQGGNCTFPVFIAGFRWMRSHVLCSL
jgi:transposase